MLLVIEEQGNLSRFDLRSEHFMPYSAAYLQFLNNFFQCMLFMMGLNFFPFSFWKSSLKSYVSPISNYPEPCINVFENFIFLFINNYLLDSFWEFAIL